MTCVGKCNLFFAALYIKNVTPGTKNTADCCIFAWYIFADYGNTDCGVYKQGIQNYKDFCLRIFYIDFKSINWIYFTIWISYCIWQYIFLCMLFFLKNSSRDANFPHMLQYCLRSCWGALWVMFNPKLFKATARPWLNPSSACWTGWRNRLGFSWDRRNSWYLIWSFMSDIPGM